MKKLQSVSEAITLAESKRLVELEVIIKRGKKVFIEVGLALAEIRDSRLYRIEHPSFESYCKKKWNFGKSYAHQLIESAIVVQSLPQKVSAMADSITSERQARAIAKVEPERRAEVLEKAASNGKLTAKSITEAASPAPEPAKPIIEVPAEVAFVQRQQDVLPTKSPMDAVIEGLEAILLDLKEPNPFEPPNFEELANELIACARNLRVIAKQEAA